MPLLFTKPKPKAKPITPVETRHIPYIETLWNQLQDARAQLAAKEQYVREAAALGVKVAAVERVADATATDGAAVRRAVDELERIKQLLAAGAEPTTPPRDWYCGALTKPEPMGKDRWGDDVYPQEDWPNRSTSRSVAFFQGAMPVEALRRYAATKHLIDDARVYSPRETDFYRMPEPELRDPVLIGLVTFLGTSHYFELARWDIDADLAVVFGKLGKTPGGA